MKFSNKHTARDKHLLRLERELKRLNHAQWRAPIIPLEHPYQRGWAKTFMLREDATHHPDASIFAAVLPVINERVHSVKREFINRAGHTIALRPRIIDKRTWSRLNWSGRHQRLFSYGTWPAKEFFAANETYYRSELTGFKLTRTWWLAEKIEPHLITHQRVELPAVRSRIAEIRSFFEKRSGHERLRWLHGRHSHWHGRSLSPSESRCEHSTDEQLRTFSLSE